MPVLPDLFPPLRRYLYFAFSVWRRGPWDPPVLFFLFGPMTLHLFHRTKKSVHFCFTMRRPTLSFSLPLGRPDLFFCFLKPRGWLCPRLNHVFRPRAAPPHPFAETYAFFPFVCRSRRVPIPSPPHRKTSTSSYPPPLSAFLLFSPGFRSFPSMHFRLVLGDRRLEIGACLCS